mgnify:CR=1 FL=1
MSEKRLVWTEIDRRTSELYVFTGANARLVGRVVHDRVDPDAWHVYLRSSRSRKHSLNSEENARKQLEAYP